MSAPSLNSGSRSCSPSAVGPPRPGHMAGSSMQGKCKALKLNFANLPFKSTTWFTLNPSGVQNPLIERLRTPNIESSGKLNISPEQHWNFTAGDLKDLGEIG
uniref:Uncharacterized protein n=1 Tax=Monodelphis domestica TaxID=13616 RepID=A0A5F8H4J0_MONDO